jgi:hypothetical protein
MAVEPASTATRLVSRREFRIPGSYVIRHSACDLSASWRLAAGGLHRDDGAHARLARGGRRKSDSIRLERVTFAPRPTIGGEAGDLRSRRTATELEPFSDLCLRDVAGAPHES